MFAKKDLWFGHSWFRWNTQTLLKMNRQWNNATAVSLTSELDHSHIEPW